MRVRYGCACSGDSRFIGSRSASMIGVDVLVRESHELLLLSEEFAEIGVHRYVQYTQEAEGRWWRMYEEEETRRT